MIATPPLTDAIDGRMAPNAPSFPATASPSLVAIVTTTVVVFGDVDSDGREGEGEGEEITNVCSTIIVEEVAAAPELRPSIKARVPTAHSNPCQRMFARCCSTVVFLAFSIFAFLFLNGFQDYFGYLGLVQRRTMARTPVWTLVWGIFTAMSCLGNSSGGVPDNRRGWAEMRREKLRISRTVPASDGPFLFPLLRYGPNNQLLQFFHSVAIARYTGATVIAPEFGGHLLERTAGARKYGHSLEEMLDVDILLSGVRLASTGKSIPRSRDNAFGAAKTAAAPRNASSIGDAPPTAAAEVQPSNSSSSTSSTPTKHLAVAPEGYVSAANKWLFPSDVAQAKFLKDQSKRIAKFADSSLFTYGLWSAHRALDLSPADEASCSVLGSFRDLRTRNDVLVAIEKYSTAISRIHANHGVALMEMTLGQSPFGGLAIDSADSFYKEFVKNNLWARLNLEMINYYSPPPKIRELAEHAAGSALLGIGRYIAVHIRVSDDCNPSVDVLHQCFSPGGVQIEEHQMWDVLAEHALSCNATKLFVAFPAAMRPLFRSTLWPDNAVTSVDLPEARRLSNWDLSIFEQAVSSNAKGFVYTGRSRQGKKVTSLSTGKQHHKVGGETSGRHKEPPNTSTWAMMVLLVRMTLRHRASRDSLSTDVSIESLLTHDKGVGRFNLIE